MEVFQGKDDEFDPKKVWGMFKFRAGAVAINEFTFSFMNIHGRRGRLIRWTVVVDADKKRMRAWSNAGIKKGTCLTFYSFKVMHKGFTRLSTCGGCEPDEPEIWTDPHEDWARHFDYLKAIDANALAQKFWGHDSFERYQYTTFSVVPNNSRPLERWYVAVLLPDHAHAIKVVIVSDVFKIDNPRTRFFDTADEFLQAIEEA